MPPSSFLADESFDECSHIDKLAARSEGGARPRQGSRIGQLYFYYASMNAGKSTTLLQSSFQLSGAGHGDDAVYAAVHDGSATADRFADRVLKAQAHTYEAGTDIRAEVEAELARVRSMRHRRRGAILSRAQVLQLASIADDLAFRPRPTACAPIQANLFEGSANSSLWPTRS